MYQQLWREILPEIWVQINQFLGDFFAIANHHWAAEWHDHCHREHGDLMEGSGSTARVARSQKRTPPGGENLGDFHNQQWLIVINNG